MSELASRNAPSSIVVTVAGIDAARRAERANALAPIEIKLSGIETCVIPDLKKAASATDSTPNGIGARPTHELLRVTVMSVTVNVPDPVTPPAVTHWYVPPTSTTCSPFQVLPLPPKSMLPVTTKTCGATPMLLNASSATK